MPKKSENYLNTIGSLALVLNVCLQDEMRLYEIDTDKLVWLHNRLSKAYECIKGVFSMESVVSQQPNSSRSSWCSLILSRYTNDANDKSLCRNMMRITGSKNWYVGHSFDYCGDYSQSKEDFVNFTSVLIKIKNYLEKQSQSFNPLTNLKSLPSPKCCDKSVQCSKSTEFLKDLNKLVSPSPRAISAKVNKTQYGQLHIHKTSCSEPRVNLGRLSLRRRRAESCPECRETKILANVKRRIDQDLGVSRIHSRTCCTSCGNSLYLIQSDESFSSVGCSQCEEMIRLHHHRHQHNQHRQHRQNCSRCHCWVQTKNRRKPWYSVDSGIDLPALRSDDECSQQKDKEVQADLTPTQSTETISTIKVDGAVKKFTEELILCERSAKENSFKKHRPLSPTSECSSSNSTWNYLKNLNNLSEDELISGISTPSLVSLTDLEDAT